MDETEGTSFGQCRICRSEGSHRYVRRAYYSNGVKEIYYDMFVKCFNLHLKHSADNMLVCLFCVQQLRDANTFRVRVVDSEQKLVQTVNDSESILLEGPLEQVNKYDIKVEIAQRHIKQETDFEDDESLHAVDTQSSDTELVEGEAALLARFPRGAAPLPTRRSLYSTCKAFVSHLDSLRGKEIPSDKVLQSMLTTKSTSLANKRIYLTEKLAHVTNVCTLLENSNVTPFKSKNRSGYPCYYCWKICENLQTLKNHQRSEQTKNNIKRIMNKYTVDGLVMYVDVTNLKCTICDKEIPSLNNLKEHLSKVHKKEWCTNVEDRVLPFKLSEENNFECQICGFTFETFGSIERHMNVHYRNYVCEECGAGFVNKLRLKVHMKTLHVGGSFPCVSCKKMFNTQQKYRTHVDSVHKMLKKNKCPKCPERFAEYFKRQKHMVEVHGLAPLKYKCNVCDKTYNRRYHLSCHMKRCHLEEKDIQCQFCSYMCYTKGELTAHMVKHNSERAFECSVCKKSYARKKTLKEHMRIHNNDRRFACAICGQAFVQNCSLKGHMKTHHPEYVT